MRSDQFIKVKIQKHVRDKVRELEKRMNLTFAKNDLALDKAANEYELRHTILENRVSNLTKLVYIGVGICFAFELLSKILWK